MKITTYLIILGACLFVTFIGLVAFDSAYAFLNTETVIIKGKIIDVSPVDNSVNRLNITFDTNQSFIILDLKHRIDDFSMHSKVIVSLSHSKHFFNWMATYPYDWVIDTYLIVPDMEK